MNQLLYTSYAAKYKNSAHVALKSRKKSDKNDCIEMKCLNYFATQTGENSLS